MFAFLLKFLFDCLQFLPGFHLLVFQFSFLLFGFHELLPVLVVLGQELVQLASQGDIAFGLVFMIFVCAVLGVVKEMREFHGVVTSMKVLLCL